MLDWLLKCEKAVPRPKHLTLRERHRVPWAKVDPWQADRESADRKPTVRFPWKPALLARSRQHTRSRTGTGGWERLTHREVTASQSHTNGSASDSTGPWGGPRAGETHSGGVPGARDDAP